MRDFFKIIVFFGVVVFMFNGCKATKPSLPDRPGKTVHVTTEEELQQAVLHAGGRGAIFIWNQGRNIVVERNVFVGCDCSISFGNPSEPTNYEPGTLHNYDGIIRNNFIIADTGQGTGIEVIWMAISSIPPLEICT